MAINQGWFRGEKQVADRGGNQEVKHEPLPEGWVEVGGVRRPMTDVERKRNLKQKTTPTGYHPGGSPRVKKDANVYAKSVYEARNNKKLQYRFSSMQTAPKFDRKAYDKDPKKYLQEVAPGRINQALPAGKDVTPIKRVGKYIYDNVVQGESVKLQVKTEPNVPTTFHTNRLGHFKENQLTTITVASNEEGIAEVEFEISGGTQDSIDVRAVSPVHSSDARWLINVVRPTKTDKK